MAECDNPSGKDDTLPGVRKSKLKSSELQVNRAVLLVLSEDNFGKAFVIGKPFSDLGRGTKCNIRIDDPLISTMHCRIEAGEDGKYYIEDCGSTNATYLNRKVLRKKTHLLYGDRIVAGKTILRFFLEEDLDENI